MKIYVASDHAGFAYKEGLLPFLTALEHEVEDCGALSFSPDDDYPDFVTPCATKVVNEPGSIGIILGASGQGEAMAANRIPGIRAAVYYGPEIRAQTDVEGEALSLLASVRSHNDANILSLGARFLTEAEVQEAVRIFLDTPFSNDERHIRRIRKF